MIGDSVKLPRMAAMVLAGGRVGELGVLTLRRPKSALPFAGYYRVIDFALTNLMRAGINHVGILSQYRPGSLIDHVGVGESWDFVGLDRGAKILPPYRGAEGSGWYQGNADAVYQNLAYIRDRQAEVVLILSGDHIYSMDFRQLIRFHLEQKADMTVAVKRMGHHERFGYAALDPSGRMVGYEEKPVHPSSDLASLTIYAINAVTLVEVLSQLSGRPQVEFGADVLPLMLENYRVFGYEFDGYWAYTRTVNAYYAAHQDLLARRCDLDQWQVRTNLQDSEVAGMPPPTIRRGARVQNSFVSVGCDIAGTVIGSILSPGVRVERGAEVVDSVLFHRCTVDRGASVRLTIADKQASVGAEARIGPEAGRTIVDPAGNPLLPITLLGKECRIAPGARLLPGTEVAPESVVVG
jgi:glucose-1-phosphate adenylyltransferase